MGAAAVSICVSLTQQCCYLCPFVNKVDFPVSGFLSLCKFPSSHPPGRRHVNMNGNANCSKYCGKFVGGVLLATGLHSWQGGGDQVIGESRVSGGCCHPSLPLGSAQLLLVFFDPYFTELLTATKLTTKCLVGGGTAECWEATTA